MKSVLVKMNLKLGRLGWCPKVGWVILGEVSGGLDLCKVL